MKQYLLNLIRESVSFLILFLMIILTGIQATGQNEYHLFTFYEPFKPDSTGKLYIAVDNANFFKNNENKLLRSADYTITGAFLRPKAVYYPDPKLRTELGIHVLKYNGRDDYAHISPWFNVHYQPTEKIALILGNLDADQGHLLPEQLFNPEQIYTSKPEAGLQARYNSTRFSADLWIDWQKMILPGDPYKERFVFGVRSNLLIFDSKEASLSFPFIFYGMHEGGTIDSAPGLAKSFLTITPGLVFTKKISGNLITDLQLNTSFSLSTYPKDNLIFKQTKGYGFYANATIHSSLGGLSAAFWHGHLFYTPQGTPIYQNYPGTGTGWLTNHELIDLKYNYQYQIFKDTNFGFMFDYYYDTIRMKAVNSEALYLIVNFGVLTRRAK